MNLNGSVALVTGANRGLGARLVQELLQAGAAKVYAASRTPGAVAATSDPARSRPDWSGPTTSCSSTSGRPSRPWTATTCGNG
jgi:NAD(P)-dependent dehydrogenase (short-subunit alcohol dehydrogenase family)